MIGAAVGLPFSTAEAAEVEIARHIEGAGFGISSALTLDFRAMRLALEQ